MQFLPQLMSKESNQVYALVPFTIDLAIMNTVLIVMMPAVWNWNWNIYLFNDHIFFPSCYKARQSESVTVPAPQVLCDDSQGGAALSSVATVRMNRREEHVDPLAFWGHRRACAVKLGRLSRCR